MTLNIVIFGLSITSSWGNGHAATYRALARALDERGHRVSFLERNVPWYENNRDLPNPDYCRVFLYDHLHEAARRFGTLVADADLVIIGSYVPDGIALADWITRRASGVSAFYDIDTPVTMAGLRNGQVGYLAPHLIPRFDLYLSFTGGPLLKIIEDTFGSPRARALHCAADVAPSTEPASRPLWTLGYLGTYSPDRQAGLHELLLHPAHKLADQAFVVAGSQYPAELTWPANVARIEHLPPDRHAQFYRNQRFTLNVTRSEMRAAGYSPSVRLFEAAGAGVPIISDRWPGLETFFAPNREILTAHNAQEVIEILTDISEERRHAIAAAARARLFASHTPLHRARQLEDYYQEVVAERRENSRLEVVA